jgi:hypothetical protein
MIPNLHRDNTSALRHELDVVVTHGIAQPSNLVDQVRGAGLRVVKRERLAQLWPAPTCCLGQGLLDRVDLVLVREYQEAGKRVPELRDLVNVGPTSVSLYEVEIGQGAFAELFDEVSNLSHSATLVIGTEYE